MRTLSDYEAAFDAATKGIWDMPYNTLAEARHIIAEANRATIKKRKELEADITRAWREGFALIKAANDLAQSERDAWEANERASIKSELDAAIAQCNVEFK